MTGRRIIVTGGASGLGRAVAEALRENGDTPIVFDLAAGETGASGDGLEAVSVDVTDREAVEAAVARVGESGDVDGVVTAAGIAIHSHDGDRMEKSANTGWSTHGDFSVPEISGRPSPAPMARTSNGVTAATPRQPSDSSTIPAPPSAR